MDVTELAMLLETMDLQPVTPEIFREAAEKAKTFKIDDEQKLQLYGMFKQCTVGNVNVPAPEPSNFIERAKWEAWKAYEGFPREAASKAYVYIVDQMEAEGKELAVGADAAGHQPAHFVSAVSTLILSGGDEQWPEEFKLLNFVVENNLEAVTAELNAGANVNAKNEEGMTALHYAADRGFFEMAQLLLARGADRSIQDLEGQTALDYAVLCEHQEIIELLSSDASSPDA